VKKLSNNIKFTRIHKRFWFFTHEEWPTFRTQQTNLKVVYVTSFVDFHRKTDIGPVPNGILPQSLHFGDIM